MCCLTYIAKIEKFVFNELTLLTFPANGIDPLASNI